MRPFVGILLAYWILGSCFPQSDFSQLANLPSLYQHFKLHQAEAVDKGESLSVGTFLMLHYAATTADHPDDTQSHQNLPLKTIQDFQWVDGKQIVLSFLSLEGISFCFPGLATKPLPEGIQSSVFRPPLAG